MVQRRVWFGDEAPLVPVVTTARLLLESRD